MGDDRKHLINQFMILLSIMIIMTCGGSGRWGDGGELSNYITLHYTKSTLQYIMYDIMFHHIIPYYIILYYIILHCGGVALFARPCLCFNRQVCRGSGKGGRGKKGPGWLCSYCLHAFCCLLPAAGLQHGQFPQVQSRHFKLEGPKSQNRGFSRPQRDQSISLWSSVDTKGARFLKLMVRIRKKNTLDDRRMRGTLDISLL